MANIKLTLPGEPFTKQIVTFTAPCDCDKVTDGIVINGKTYTICDAMGNKIPGTGGVWCSGAQISVVLDCENKKAYLQNGKPTPGMIGAASNDHTHTAADVDAVSKSGDTMNVGAKLNFKASDGTGFGIKYVTQGTNITASNDIEDENANRYVLRFCPPHLKNPAEALRMAEVKDGKTAWATILHTGNMDALLGGFAKVVTGSYTGTGTYGKDNPNSLTFDRAVKFLWIFAEKSTGNHWTPHDASQHTKHAVSDCELTTEWVAGVGLGGNTSAGTDNAWGKKSADGKTVYWYSGTNASWQFNQPGAEYFYMAILE